jgi:hypothetical protein
MKKLKTVVDAETALNAKAAEVTAAKDALKRLESELAGAHAAVRQAQADADATLPQCRLVRVRWRSGIEDEGAGVVIVRRTPSGMLVVRYVGDASGSEYKFKWAEHSGKYRQADKSSFTSDTRELRDVPAEYQQIDQDA